MFITMVLAGLKRAITARRTAHYLSTFSDRELADLGITRHQIDAAVRGNLRPFGDDGRVASSGADR